MGKIATGLLAAACAALALCACGNELRWDRSRTELLWAERQVVFALSPARGRLDAYSVRSGVSWLGGLALPAGECFHAQALDAAGGRLWLWSERGGLLVDARRLTVVARWHGDVAPAPPAAAMVMSRAEPALGLCVERRATVADATLADGR